MDKETLRLIINDQQKVFNDNAGLIERDISIDKYLKGNEIIIISGVRRCGKSSLLKLISKKIPGKKVYINFDDIRFTDFNMNNFSDIDNMIEQGSNTTYFLDEIQNIEYWEKWVNNLNAKGIKVFVTGSNSKLLSSEISTYLTGRNKIIKLYPFSFTEFLRLKGISIDYKTSSEKSDIVSSFHKYLDIGGFPLVIRNDDTELTKQYFEDILNKDIIRRYHIRKVKELNDLIVYLFSHAGNIYSYSTLKQVSSIKSLSMIKNYIHFLEEVFVAKKVDLFDYSIKKQKTSSSKFYSLDIGFLNVIAFNFTENRGKRLENLIFIELIRKGYNVYYHNKIRECDFVIKEGLKITKALQVCVNISDPQTRKREIDGLMDAMTTYKLQEGIIITLDQEENLKLKNKKIEVIPAWKWLLGKG